MTIEGTRHGIYTMCCRNDADQVLAEGDLNVIQKLHMEGKGAPELKYVIDYSLYLPLILYLE